MIAPQVMLARNLDTNVLYTGQNGTVVVLGIWTKLLQGKVIINLNLYCFDKLYVHDVLRCDCFIIVKRKDI